ncbi:FecR family protein [Chitinophaga sp. 22620]|uniref:FecR family protein n=1 Tax=Chitinophaga sp. 22620 TaxID=3453952 RepID=UPI003F86B8FA
MEQQRLHYLFRAWFQKTATAQEREEFTRLLQQAGNSAELKQWLTDAWHGLEQAEPHFSAAESEAMLAGILSSAPGKPELRPVSGGKKRHFSKLAIAASILLAITSGALLWLTGPDKLTPGGTPRAGLSSQVITYGSDQAILTLADGSTITLDSSGKGEISRQGSTLVMQSQPGQLSYEPSSGTKGELIYNTITTPRGGQFRLQLQDGTRIWLNASSSLRFPAEFGPGERDVELTGEAYFEVAKDAARPFRVKAKDMRLEVLGTSFNVMAYHDERTVNTSLLEGAVKVSGSAGAATLKPGQQARMSSDALKVAAADMDEAVAWKNGWFQFNSAPFETVMRQISRWYDVDVVYAGKIPEGHYSGLVSRKNDISAVLRILESGNVKVKITGKKLVVE